MAGRARRPALPRDKIDVPLSLAGAPAPLRCDATAHLSLPAGLTRPPRPFFIYFSNRI